MKNLRTRERRADLVVAGVPPANSSCCSRHDCLYRKSVDDVLTACWPVAAATVTPRAVCHKALRTRQRSGARSWWWARPWRWSRPRSRSGCRASRRCWSSSRSRCGRWCRCGAARRCLDCNRHRRTCLKEADRCIASLRRLIGIESEVIQCAPANRVRVLVLRDGFAAPCYRIGGLNNIPRRAVVTLIILGAVI